MFLLFPVILMFSLDRTPSALLLQKTHIESFPLQQYNVTN